MTLAEALSTATEARGLTLQELADLTGLDVESLRRIASGNAMSIKLATLSALAEELQLAFHWKDGWSTGEVKL